MKAVAGRPLALECVARGQPPPTLSWHHEGLPVAESNETWLEAGGRVLTLEGLGEASGGLYNCVASSPAGEAVLQYSVEVQGEPGTVPLTRVTWAMDHPSSPHYVWVPATLGGYQGVKRPACLYHLRHMSTQIWAGGLAKLHKGTGLSPRSRIPVPALDPKPDRLG